MIPHINMLCSFMKHLIFCKANSTLTITKYNNARIISTKLSIQTSQPNSFFECFRNSHIFSFSG
uniref:Uncharacterized protein n=1 Tax=Arundo donax TaxID=35708 RepID=A0A0A9HEM9_ARUDO